MAGPGEQPEPASLRSVPVVDIRPSGAIHMSMLKVIEVLAESERSWEDAAQIAVANASETLNNIRSIYIKEFNAEVENGKIIRYRINAKISFALEGLD